MNGVVVIDKPPRMTSHDVVNRVRRILGQRSVGHLGTLDPSATGVLPIMAGTLTRLAQFYTRSDKVYEGIIRFGFATDSYDADGEPTTPASTVRLDIDELRALAAEFLGLTEQTPPPFSAKKIAGVPAYKLARRKQEVVLKPVTVEIKELEVLSVDGINQDQVRIRARVGSGTYMRSLAHDLGRRLGCGAHLLSLRRTAVAEFLIDDAHTLAELEQAVQQGSADQIFVHPRKLLSQFPSVAATDENIALIRAGRSVNLPELSRAPLVKVFRGQRELIAIATRLAGTLFHAGIVFPAETEKGC
ncbi:MAG TPA: tRNA pseudouridine(55) synthase TruB [Terriglobales bacterium]|nr:tRNA pseudouridine(55) synthase TruB [Terriglobales bacterium]